MPSFNKVILMGNLTRDPEMRYTPSNMPVCNFGLAVNRKWKDQGGQMQEEVCFVDCEAWGRTAEVINQYTHKGEPLHIEGRLKLDQWEDKDGGKRYKLKVVVESVQLMGGKRDASPDPPHRQRSPMAHTLPPDDQGYAPPRTRVPVSPQRAMQYEQHEPADESSIPF